MGIITDISDLDPIRWPNSQWRSVKVGWDESTAGERPHRIPLWEIEPLTTFPMYPSFFPLRIKRPWHPGLPSAPEDGANAFPRLHADGALNFQSSGVGPLIQQRWEPLLLRNEYDQFHAMPIPALQDKRGGEFSHHKFLSYQEPYQFLQQSSKTASFFPQQFVQQAQTQQINHVQFQSLSENQSHSIQHQHSSHLHNEQNQQQAQHIQAYAENFMIPPVPSHQHYSHVLSPLCEKLPFPDSRTNLLSATPFFVQNVLGSTYPEGSTTNLSSRLGQPIISEQNRGPWEPRFIVSQSTHFDSSGLVPSFPEKDVSVETESCTADSQNHTVFGSRTNFHTLPSYAGPCSITNTIGPDVSTLPYTASYIQNSLYGCLGESSGTLQTAGVVDPPTTTFVKVHKSGSVGRSLDISQFSNYEELREELGHMYGIEGQLEDPFRSGWQLLFVDREEDVLLLGDDPWEQFVNNVWYIKILSPEDVQKMGKQGV